MLIGMEMQPVAHILEQRWPQPDGSSLSPDSFVPLAEQTGLISRLTHHERLINFQRVDVQILQIAQAGIARAKIIDVNGVA